MASKPQIPQIRSLKKKPVRPAAPPSPTGADNNTDSTPKTAKPSHGAAATKPEKIGTDSAASEAWREPAPEWQHSAHRPTQKITPNHNDVEVSEPPNAETKTLTASETKAKKTGADSVLTNASSNPPPGNRILNTISSPTITPTPSDVEVSDNDADEATEQYHFQAIGTLYGTVTKNEEDIFFIQLGRNRYRLFVPGYRRSALTKQYENNPEPSLYFRVYPKILAIPKKQPELYFQVVAWDERKQWGEPGVFTLKGIWQFVPQFRAPVISVYRNAKADDPTGKFKAAHIPVLMRREDEANPFRFNPKVAKEDLPPRWFIQGTFKLITSRDSFGWVEDLAEPSKEIPWYKRPRKEVTGGKSGPTAEKVSGKKARNEGEK